MNRSRIFRQGRHESLTGSDPITRLIVFRFAHPYPSRNGTPPACPLLLQR